MVHAAKILGTPLKGRVPGIDFASALVERLARSGLRLFLLGAKPGVAEQAGENLKKRYPDLLLCGTHDGYFQTDGPVVDQIRAARADVVFVCLGAPKQERWMAQYGPETGAHLMVGLGGVLDVYAGHVKRAPEIWQKLGLEWCYRLLHQPSRLGRMAKLPLFLLEAAGKRESGESHEAGALDCVIEGTDGSGSPPSLPGCAAGQSTRALPFSGCVSQYRRSPPPCCGCISTESFGRKPGDVNAYAGLQLLRGGPDAFLGRRYGTGYYESRGLVLADRYTPPPTRSIKS